MSKCFGPIFEQVLEKERVLFLVTTSTSPSLQAYAELHALSPLCRLISPWLSTEVSGNLEKNSTVNFSTWAKISIHFECKISRMRQN